MHNKTSALGVKKFELDNAVILADEFSLASKPEIMEFIKSKEALKIANITKEKFYMVLGWDGTMLRAIEQTYKDNLAYLGINFWSKWFLLNEKDFVLKENEVFKKMEYPLLYVEVNDGKNKFRQVAFNEAQVKTSGWHLIDINMQVGDNSKIRLKWDWVLVVTPAWSTGYNISAGWPVLPHTSPNFIATPLLSFEPRNMKSIIFENNKEVVITNNNERWYELSVYADSTPLVEKNNHDLEIRIRKSKTAVKLLIAGSYEQIWNGKIFSEQWFEMIK